jgi:hypothetical protein
MDMKINSLTITQDILSLIAEIDEFKGAWRALGQLAPERLTSLKKLPLLKPLGHRRVLMAASLQIKKSRFCLANLTIQKFSSRDEQEVAGYATVINLVFRSYEHIPPD